MDNIHALGTFVSTETHVEKIHIGNWTIEKNTDETLVFSYNGVFQFIVRPDA